MDQPLRGVSVLDLSRLLPGPYCTLILSDLGARVDKIEPLEGDALRWLSPLRGGMGRRFAALNRDKRSLCLDLKHPAGRDALLRLVPRYDVIVEGFRPGVMERLGLGYATLTAANPRLVVCSLSGYGQTGPDRTRAGHDLGFQALAGTLAMTGQQDGPPVMPGAQLADLAGGGLWGALGVLAALHAAQTTGRGEHVDLSLCEGTLALLLPEIACLADEEPPPRRGETPLTGGLAAYGIYATRDGRHLAVAALEPKFWLAFNQAIERPAEAGEVGASRKEQERIRREIESILITRTLDEWLAVLQPLDVCVEPVLEVAALSQHPQHRARRVFFSLDGVEQVRTPLAGDQDHRPAPSLGEHGGTILDEAGFSREEIDALRASGVTR